MGINEIWTRLKCLVIGFDYELIKDSSIRSKKLLTKYFSAVLIIVIVWFMIGFLIIEDYVDSSNILMSISAGLIFAFIIVMVERQIILGANLSILQMIFRFFLGIVMAFIGAILIDGALFQNDIEIEKKILNRDKIEQRIAIKNQEVREIIDTLQREKEKYQEQLNQVQQRLAKEGGQKTKKAYSKKTVFVRDENGNQVLDSLGNPRTTTVYDYDTVLIDNPDIQTAERISNYLTQINSELQDQRSMRIQIREDVINEVNNEKGIIEDLIILKNLIMRETVSIVFYLLWFLFFLFLELLVLVSKISEKKSTCDYYERVNYQEKMSQLKLSRLLKNSEAEVLNDSHG